MTPAAFKGGLIEAAAALPPPEPDGSHEAQKHVTLLIHGYNSSWGGAATWYQKIVDSIFRADDGLGIPVLFTWPSKGSPAEYLADRREAEDAAGGLAEVLSELYDWLVGVQARSLEDPTLACRAKTSIIAHSMGNYVLQKAAAVAWARKNKPLLVSLVNQLVMVAADVDNDLFKSGEMVDQSDGDALANLTYRITALYSGLDQVLGVSAGLKHFGKRRLGRSGLDTSDGPPDNVWDFDCTSLFQVDHVGGFNAHGAYFDEPSTMNLMRLILSGLDREMIRRQVRVAEAGAR
jgi:esterase/lipase superfamily enzyme